MPVIEKHDLNDVLEVQKIRELIKGHRSSLEFFETMLRLINKNINGKVIQDSISEASTEDMPDVESSESDEEGSLSDLE
jgi:hypothetical protein